MRENMVLLYVLTECSKAESNKLTTPAPVFSSRHRGRLLRAAPCHARVRRIGSIAATLYYKAVQKSNDFIKRVCVGEVEHAVERGLRSLRRKPMKPYSGGCFIAVAIHTIHVEGVKNAYPECDTGSVQTVLQHGHDITAVQLLLCGCSLFLLRLRLFADAETGFSHVIAHLAPPPGT